MQNRPFLNWLRGFRALVWAYRTALRARNYALFLCDFLRFCRMNDGRFPMSWATRHPCPGDRTASTGFDAHYVFHTAWAARILAERPPRRHVDISSCLRFVTIASAFVPMDFYDWRPANISLSSLSTGQADLTKLPFADGSVPSLSCMHVVEHVGLGRYGDALDPQGDLKAFSELARVLAPGGRLLICLPMAEKPMLAFHAHRVYSYSQVIASLPGLTPERFDLISDNAMAEGMLMDAHESDLKGQRYACGCFVFSKSGGA